MRTHNNINILVSRKKLEWIAHNFRVSDHAEFRMVQRDSKLNRDLRTSILNSPLAWYSYTGAIVVALNLYEYVVISVENDDPCIITFSNMEDNKTQATVVDKMFVDYRKTMQLNRKNF